MIDIVTPCIRIIDPADIEAGAVEFHGFHPAIEPVDTAFPQDVHLIGESTHSAPVFMVAGHIIARIFPADSPEEGSRIPIRQLMVKNIPSQQHQVRLLRVDRIQKLALIFSIRAGMQVSHQSDPDRMADSCRHQVIAHDFQPVVKTGQDQAKQNRCQQQKEFCLLFHLATPE